MWLNTKVCFMDLNNLIHLKNLHEHEQINMNSNSISQDNPNAFKNTWVLGWLALVGAAFLGTIGLVITAFALPDQLISKDYYEKAEDYEKNFIKYRNARAALGWSYQAEFPTSPVLNKKNQYRLTVVDKVGQPLTAASIILKAYRPSDASADFEVQLTEVAPGIYAGDISYPLKGIWDVTADITHGDDKYDFTRRASIVTE